MYLQDVLSRYWLFRAPDAQVGIVARMSGDSGVSQDMQSWFVWRPWIFRVAETAFAESNKEGFTLSFRFESFCSHFKSLICQWLWKCYFEVRGVSRCSRLPAGHQDEQVKVFPSLWPKADVKRECWLLLQEPSLSDFHRPENRYGSAGCIHRVMRSFLAKRCLEKRQTWSYHMTSWAWNQAPLASCGAIVLARFAVRSCQGFFTIGEGYWLPNGGSASACPPHFVQCLWICMELLWKSVIFAVLDADVLNKLKTTPTPNETFHMAIRTPYFQVRMPCFLQKSLDFKGLLF